MTNTEILNAGVAGAGSVATAVTTTNLELNKVLFVGALGAVAYLMKNFDVPKFKENKLAELKTIPARILTPMAVTAIVYYVGTDGLNIYVKDVGTPVWTFAGLLAALNYEVAVGGIGDILSIGIEKLKGWRR